MSHEAVSALTSSHERVLKARIDLAVKSSMVVGTIESMTQDIAKLEAEVESLRRLLRDSLAREQALEARLPRVDRESYRPRLPMGFDP